MSKQHTKTEFGHRLLIRFT